MNIRKGIVCALFILFGGGLALWAISAEAGPAYQPSGKHDDLPTYEGRIVSLNKDGGRVSVRGDGGFRSFSVHPKKIEKMKKGDLVRIRYERVDSGNKAVVLLLLDKPVGASSDEAIAETKEKLIEKGIIKADSGALDSAGNSVAPSPPDGAAPAP